MATRTPYYGLNKPLGTEDAQVSVINANMDIIDSEMNLNRVRGAKNLAPVYDPTSSYVENDYVTYLITGQSSQDANGYFVFKCIEDTTEPAGNFDTNKWVAVCITDEMGSGGGGGGEGGHIFLNNEGTAMPQRAKAKFEGAYSTDNSTDDITNVAVLRTMSASRFAQLTEAEKQGFIYVYDETTGTDDKFQPVIYSTEEREIGVWTDGKPLYQKTVHISALPSTAYTDIQYAHNISNIDKIISWKGFTSFANGSTLQFDRSFSSLSYEGNTSFSATVDKTAINVRVGTDRSTMSADFTIQYTKTTDQAGSGQWTPQGVPAVHYSTDEKVIGTWIDGKTLYEKTVSFTTGSEGVYNTYLTDIENPDTMFIDFSHSYYKTSNTAYLPILPYVNIVGGIPTGMTAFNSTITMLLGKQDDKLRIDYRVGSNDVAGKTVYVTVQYTKSL